MKESYKPIIKQQDFVADSKLEPSAHILQNQQSSMICLRRNFIDSSMLSSAMNDYPLPPDLQAVLEKMIVQDSLMPVFDSCIPLPWIQKSLDPKRDSIATQSASSNQLHPTMERGNKRSKGFVYLFRNSIQPDLPSFFVLLI